MNTIERLYNFQKYVKDTLLEYDMCIFGGAVRNSLWRSIHEFNRIERTDDMNYLEKIWDTTFDPDTVYNRTGIYKDIDAIVVEEIFDKFCDEMKKHNRLKLVRKSTKQEVYGSSEVNELLKENLVKRIDMYVYPPFTVDYSFRVSADLFVCTSVEVSNRLKKTLANGVEYQCNKLCIEKYGNKIVTSVLGSSDVTKLAFILGQMKEDLAMRDSPYTVAPTYRTAKMIEYGWYVDVGPLYNYFRNPIVYVFIRATDSEECNICHSSLDGEEYNGRYLFVKIESKIAHSKCYIQESIRCREILEQSDRESEAFVEAEGSEEVFNGENITESAESDSFNSTNEEQSDQPQPVLTEERNDDDYWVGNVRFLSGIAQPNDRDSDRDSDRDTNEYQSASLSHVQLVEQATELSRVHSLCTSENQKQLLERIYKLDQYILSNFINPKR